MRADGCRAAYRSDLPELSVTVVTNERRLAYGMDSPDTRREDTTAECPRTPATGHRTQDTPPPPGQRTADTARCPARLPGSA